MKNLFLLSLLSSVIILLSTSCNREYTEVEYVTGYTGEARRNPYLAASKLLQKNGYGADESYRLSFDAAEHDCVVIPASSIRGKAQIDKLMDFLNDGGHVIFCLQYGEKTYNDFGHSMFSSEAFRTFDDEQLNSLLSKFDMELNYEPESTDSQFYGVMNEEQRNFYEVPDADSSVINIEGEEYVARLGGSYGVTQLNKQDPQDQQHSEIYTDDKDVHRFISVPHGLGRFTFVSDARFMRNPHLATQNHPSLFLELVGLEYSSSVLFSSGDNPNFYDLMWKHYPYFVLSLLLLVALWLIGKSRRFGPVLEVVHSKPINFLHHVEAGGHFLWKRDKSAYLVSSLQMRARRAIGEYKHTPEQMETISEELSNQLNMIPEEVHKALYSNEKLNPLQFIKTVRTLQRIINHHD